MHQTKCYAAHSDNTPLVNHTIYRREIGKKDIFIEIEFCGVCHTDYHYAKNDWGITRYPFIGGHEIIGVIKGLGEEVKDFNLGDRVAVGCFVNSCRNCNSCNNDFEQYCTEGLIKTYNDLISDPGGHTFGGYSKSIVVDEHFVFSIPKSSVFIFLITFLNCLSGMKILIVFPYDLLIFCPSTPGTSIVFSFRLIFGSIRTSPY